MRLFERLFVMALFLSYMGAIDALTRPNANPDGLMILADKAPMSVVLVQAGIYGWGIILVCARWRRVWGAMRKTWPLLVFVALAPLSTIWSVRPDLTLQRSILMILTTLFAIYLGERYSIEELARLLMQTMCLMIVAVVILHFVAPAQVIDQKFDTSDAAHRGGWRGLSEHKNLFGQYMVLAVALFILLRFRRNQWLRYGFLGGAAALLVLSRSANAVGCGVLIVAVMPLWLSTRLKSERRLLVYAAVVLALCIASLALWGRMDLLFQILGRDSTLTGRTQIWTMVVQAIFKHPILGYGYAAFWDALGGETLDVWSAIGFIARGAHNDYLDLCLSYGLLGIPVFGYLFLCFFKLAVQYFRSESGSLALWPVTYLFFFALHNMSESGLMQSWRSLPFLMFATLFTALQIHRRRQSTVLQKQRAPEFSSYAKVQLARTA
jgi:O-antigen ligase